MRVSLFLLLAVMPVCGQRAAIRRYDTSEGLAHGTVTSIYQDAKGYVWFSTFDGVSRFDGYSFTNYGTRDGLGHPIANHVTEDREGRLWVATNGGGVARLLDEPESPGANQGAGSPAGINRFLSFQVGDTSGSNRVNRMLFDSQNGLWCATDAGLYRAAVTDSDLKFVPVISGKAGNAYASFEDRRGRLWFGVANELIQVEQDRIYNHGAVGGAGNDAIIGILEDRLGRLLIASGGGLFEFEPPAEMGRGKWSQLPLALKPVQSITTILEDASGALWLGTSGGLVKYHQGRQTKYTAAQGLSINWVRSLAEDSEGNLWIGTGGGGACKLSGEMIVNYTQTEGLPDPVVVRAFEDRAGHLMALLADSSLAEIGAERIDLSRSMIQPPVSSDSFMIEHDGQGRWWWGGPSELLVRFKEPVLRLRSGRDLLLAPLFPGAAADAFVHFYEDETGRLWMTKSDGYLYCADATRPGRLAFEGFPTDFPLPGAGPRMISDRAGGLWLGGRGMLGRLRLGMFAPVELSDGLPELEPRSFFMDSRGWLWIGLRYKGVCITREPAAEHPSFTNYSIAQGLSSGAVWTIAQDDSGKMYFGTDKGVDQLDPNTGQWRHYTTRDGLAGDRVLHLYKDRGGNIWVSTARGLSRLNPRAAREVNRPPPIYLSRVTIAGEDLRLPESGATEVQQIDLASARNNLSIEYVALSFQGEDNLTYEYRLEGVDADWSAPAKSRSVNYARLAPGAYRFLVRAIDKGGEPSPNPAGFQFRIMPPVYQRWWFLSLASVVILAAAYGLYRYRVSRLLELERVRTRIAADLHDDIGSNLTRIAILSEVAHRRSREPAPGDADQLSSIASISRESVASMSDIVWAINPRRDSLLDLSGRIRRFASETLASGNIQFQFSAPEADQYIKFGANLRRDVFLIFKEALNNVVRHSRCAGVEIDLKLERSLLLLKVRDDGQGFDPGEASQGQGLASMRRRAQALGGILRVSSHPGAGTEILLSVPRRPK